MQKKRDTKKGRKKRMEIRPSFISGRGLFATRDFKKGEVIDSIQHPVECSNAERLGFPSDSVIYLDPSYCIFDSAWKTIQSPPFWYFQNHATTGANSILVRISTLLGPSVAWKAKKKICCGSEITFNYQPGKRLVW